MSGGGGQLIGENSNSTPKTLGEKKKAKEKQISPTTPHSTHIHLTQPELIYDDPHDTRGHFKEPSRDPITRYVGDFGPVAAPRLYRAHFRWLA